MILREYQRQLVENFEPSVLHSCAVWARRIGKSSTLAYSAWSWQLDHHRRQSNIAIVSPGKAFSDIIRNYTQEMGPNFCGKFYTTPSQLRGEPIDVLYIDEADFIKQNMIETINNIIEYNPRVPVRAYGTKNHHRKDREHFWQTLKLGPCVSISYCGAEVLPNWHDIMDIKKSYFDEETYKAEILSRP